MVIQYPYYLFVLTQSGESTQDENGNWVNAEPSFVFASMCRDEISGKGASLKAADGQAVIYAAIIYLPLSDIDVQAGTDVLVSESNDPNGVLRFKGKVIRFNKGQLNIRIWA